MTKTILIDLHYFPSIAWVSVLNRSHSVQIEARENYQKGSYRNRCHLTGPSGIHRMSVPLKKGKHQQCAIKEVEISYDEAWNRSHIRTIQSLYGSAPFFDHYQGVFVPILEKNHHFLFDLNLEIMDAVLGCLKIPREKIIFSEIYRKHPPEDVSDLGERFTRKTLYPKRN